MNPTTLVWRTSVSPQHFTCLAVPSETLVCGSTLASSDAVDVPGVGRVGIEPTLRRGKNPLQSQRLLPTRLPRHARASDSRFVHHGFVLPPGVEPGPLGFQPSALPSCAKEGCRPAHGVVGATSARVLFHQVPCQAPHHQLFGCQRSPAATLVRRTSGVMRSHRCEGARVA